MRAWPLRNTLQVTHVMGNEATGAVVELFNDMANATDESNGATAKSVCTKLLMDTVKRDISGIEASYELSSLPLYRCSHQFQNVSFTGSRVLERNYKEYAIR